jgi:hypothetical protein
LRYEAPLRILAVTDHASTAAYQRIARRLRSTIEFRYEGKAGDSIYHVNDKWIEPQKNPTPAELDDYVRNVARESLGPRNGKPPADVIFSRDVDDAGLLSSVRAGAVLVTCGNVYPKDDSPFASEWPAKATKDHDWMHGAARRSEGALPLSGIPVERLSGTTWIPIAVPTSGSTTLSSKFCGSIYTRKVGEGTILFAPTGPLSKAHDVIASLSRSYDHDEIWLRLWDQLLYDAAQGARALPAWADLAPGAKEAAPGQAYLLPGRIVNRSAPGALEISVHVTTPRGKVVFKASDKVQVPVGEGIPYEVRVPVGEDWPAGLYPAYLTIGEPAAKKQLHQALQFIPVAGRLQLHLDSEKKGYGRGEQARFSLSASTSAPWTGTLEFGVYDFRGRLLAAEHQPAELTSGSKTFTFAVEMADHGVRDDTFWAEVVARKDGHEWGRAERKFYKYEQWSTRQEYQWSTWAGIACSAPSVAPEGMRLMAHAGMNALGYSGRSELYYAAERWGWRSYNEGVGVNTFSPLIEYENDTQIEAALVTADAKRRFTSAEMNSATFVLASVGEEAGYKDGWGKTYYWDTPVAPEKASRAFQWYLKERYVEIARLNATWKTAYQSWDEVKLTREFSGRAPTLAADGWAHPKESPLGAGVSGVSLAPYSDTVRFYAWYYDRFIRIAKRVLHDRINPVPITMASAPASWIFDSRECDVRLSGPNAWNESQMHSTMDGREPGFGLIWGHFDWEVKTDDMFWGFLLARSGHNNYWVDVPLMFNPDLTHTRASFAMRRWTTGLAGHERIILDSLPAPCDVALLGANGVGTDFNRANMATSLKVALMQGGFGMPLEAGGDLKPSKVVFAVGHQSVSKEEAERLNAYVEGGGTLVLSSRFACQDEFGAPVPECPGQGLAEKWGLRTSAGAKPSDPNRVQAFDLGGLGESWKGQKMGTYLSFREKVEEKGWTRLAKHDDGTPAVLTRTLGKGRLFYVNAVYASHWYIQFVTPTGAERQGFYKLVEWICEQAGARRTLRLEGDLGQMLHVAVKEFTDPTGEIRYAIVRTNGEVPWVSGSLHWLGPQTAGYEVLSGSSVGRDLPLHLRPGAGKFLAFVEKPIHRIEVETTPSRITAGQPIEVAVRILGSDGKPVRGSFPIELGVRAENGAEIPGLRRSISLQSGGTLALRTALNDPPGNWRLTLTDAISRRSGESAVTVTAPASAAGAAGFLAWGWPSEIEEPAEMSAKEFVGRLRRLSALYAQDHSAEGWMIKQRLGYYYDYFPETRHSVLRPLLDLDWGRYAGAIREAVKEGGELILTGEDLGIHPGSGLGVYPHHDAGQFAALAQALEGAAWSIATRDGDTIQATLGKGRVILCRESIDAAGHDNASLARWQKRWLEERKAGEPAGISAPDRGTLERWWVGREALVKTRTVTWMGGNQREQKLLLDPSKPLGEVFTLVIPPTGDVQELVATVTGSGAERAQFDVGCENKVDADWKKAVESYARKPLYRDDNGWRIIPVRVRSAEKIEIHVTLEKLVVQ